MTSSIGARLPSRMFASMRASSGWPSTHSSTRYGTGTPFGSVSTSTSIDFTMPASARDSSYMSRPSAMNFSTNLLRPAASRKSGMRRHFTATGLARFVW